MSQLRRKDLHNFLCRTSRCLAACPGRQYPYKQKEKRLDDKVQRSLKKTGHQTYQTCRRRPSIGSRVSTLKPMVGRVGSV